ncbi:Hypp3185 [Branchiostoma lanceolatum]|uniref:Hypp3185 protein n=1 Tax=Branchiostoma lanceolatum TaxID=7740 RepID=A0A8J9ZYY7_BRALA|nr:Hypp3185 [Branchiostoma lanceolatum]
MSGAKPRKPKPTELQHGDVLKCDSGKLSVSHYAIYDKKDNTVIHKTGPPGLSDLSLSSVSDRSQVRRDSYDNMAKYYDSVAVHNRPSETRYSGDTVVQNAEARIGETSYNLVDDNCETFARENETGRTESDQVVKVVTKAKQVVGDVASHFFGSS